MLNTKHMAGGELGPGPGCWYKRPHDDCSERQHGTSLLSDEWAPLDFDSSRLKCQQRSWDRLLVSLNRLVHQALRRQKESDGASVLE